MERMYGSLDLDCDTSDTALFSAIAARLPANAAWVTSPLKRTRQTADALIAAGAPEPMLISEDADIAEMDFGDYNGMTHAELFSSRKGDPFLGFWPMSPHDLAPNGESFTLLRDRVQQFINPVRHTHQRDIPANKKGCADTARRPFLDRNTLFESLDII